MTARMNNKITGFTKRYWFKFFPYPFSPGAVPMDKNRDICAKVKSNVGKVWYPFPDY